MIMYRSNVISVVLLNIARSIAYRSPDNETDGRYIFKYVSIADAWRSRVLFKEVFPQKNYGFFRTLLLTLVTRRFSFCVLDKSKKVVAFVFFRLSSRDVVDGTIHESYIGVHPDYAGQGLATRLRKYAMRSLERNGFGGISSRISLSNVGSLKSAESVGYKIVERYTNEDEGEEAYLVVRFDDVRCAR